jgi:hypothetical protein
MAHVETAARVGEHFEHVVAGLGTVFDGFVEFRIAPGFHPFLLDLLMVVCLLGHGKIPV